MKLEKANKRDRKRNKRLYGMRRDGDSTKIIQKETEKREARIRKKRKALEQEDD